MDGVACVPQPESRVEKEKIRIDVPTAEEALREAEFYAMSIIAQQAYQDAKAHGLYDDVNLCPQKRSAEFIRRRLTLLIREEVCEMWAAHQDPAHFAEEMADVVIMCMSAAGHLGIDLAAEVKRKMEVNRTRPFRHDKL